MQPKALFRSALLVLALGLAVSLVAANWEEVTDAVETIGFYPIAAGFLLGMPALWLSMLSWRALLRDLGSALPIGAAARVFFHGQIAKYIPGSIWTFAKFCSHRSLPGLLKGPLRSSS